MATYKSKKREDEAVTGYMKLFEEKKFSFGEKSFAVMVPRRELAELIIKKPAVSAV